MESRAKLAEEEPRLGKKGSSPRLSWELIDCCQESLLELLLLLVDRDPIVSDDGCCCPPESRRLELFISVEGDPAA
jgi:hypothetical protein